MKPTISRILTVICAAGLAAAPVRGWAQAPAPNPVPEPEPVEAPVVDPAAVPEPEPQPEPEPDAPPSARPAAKPSAPPKPAEPPPAVAETVATDPADMEASATPGPDGILLNFRNAPLDMVLSHMSEAAGFVIVLDTTVRGSVNVISSHPVSKDEAVDLLNAVLNKNGYAAIRNGRTLTIVDKATAKTRNIPVKIGSNPALIPINDEIVTQIIPIRFVEAQQLVTDLSAFVSAQATIVANEAGNSVVITDTQANIRHLAEIIKAIDSSAEGETEIRVIYLKFANPSDVVTLLGTVFPNQTSGNGQTQSPFRFGGPGGFPGFGGGGGGRGGRGGGNGGGAAAGGTTDRAQKQTQVVAAADLRTSSVVVTAAKDMMPQIESMVRELDVRSSRDQSVHVFKMDNGDPQQALQILQNMFQSTTSTRGNANSTTQTSPLMQREVNNANSSSSSVSGSTSGNSFGGAGSRTGTGGR
jgi:hypothetical protein